MRCPQGAAMVWLSKHYKILSLPALRQAAHLDHIFHDALGIGTVAGAHESLCCLWERALVIHLAAVVICLAAAARALLGLAGLLLYRLLSHGSGCTSAGRRDQLGRAP